MNRSPYVTCVLFVHVSLPSIYRRCMERHCPHGNPKHFSISINIGTKLTEFKKRKLMEPMFSLIASIDIQHFFFFFSACLPDLHCMH
jgi:hypothetical protein